MAKQKEEWQDPDSGYLNCIGVGDTFVKKQIARILNQNIFTADFLAYYKIKGFEALAGNVEFKKKEL